MKEPTHNHTASFHELYTTYHRKSYQFALSYVKESFAAEDIASEAFIKLWSVIQQGNCQKPLPLLLTILKNDSLNYLKHKKIEREAKEKIGDLELRDLNIRIRSLQACEPNEILSSEVATIVDRTLHKMERQTREIFMLSRFEYKSNNEISAITDLSVKAVEYHITKALKIMRVALSDYLTIMPLFVFLLF